MPQPFRFVIVGSGNISRTYVDAVHKLDSITISGQLIEVKPLRRTPLVPEQTDVFEGDAPAEEKVSAFLARVIPAAEEARGSGGRRQIAVEKHCLEHDIADEGDLPFVHAFPPEVGDRCFGRRKQQRRRVIREHPVDLFGHSSVE